MTVLAALPSTVPALLTNLLAELQARPGLAGVSITMGAPAGELPREYIILGDVTGTVQSAAIGSQRREERFSLAIWVSALHGTSDQYEVLSRVYAMRDEVASTLRVDGTVNGVVRWALDEGYRMANFVVSGTERQTQIEMTVGCAARI